MPVTVQSTTTEKALAAILADASGASAEFPGTFANHLPMVLVALSRLGASPERLREYAATYSDRNALHKPPRPRRMVRDWREALGDRTREGDLRAYFSEQVAAHGARAVLARTMPILQDGVAASATHGLMRLAYGALRSDSSEIAAALGYWAATWLPHRAAGATPGPLATPAELLTEMSVDPAMRGIEPRDILLWHWIREMAETDAYQSLCCRLDESDPALIDTIRACALTFYAGTMTFEALHAVTGAHWLRLSAPWLDAPGSLAARFWEVVLALYPKVGMPALPSPEELDALRVMPVADWPDIAAAAVASDDEHDHSLVFSAREEHAATGDPLYRVVAARRVGLA